MERNRAPFDLLEGERELIRGFNLEIGRSIFVLLFLSEYGILAVIAIITNLVIISKINLIRIFILGVILFIRSCFPRVRYDILMSLIWQSILPIRVCIFVLISILA